MAEEREWVLINLDEKISKRQGLPPRLPVPKDEFEGLAEKGLSIEGTRAWIKDFLTNSEPGKSGVWRKQNSQLVSALEGFIDKAPLWERAQKSFAENDYDKAIGALKRITTMDPEDHAARMNLGSALANQGDHAGALKAFKAIRKTFEGDADYHVALGHVHVALGDRDAGLGEFVLALEAKADCQPALDAMVKLGVLVPVYENPRDAASLTYVRADSVLAWLTEQWDAAAHEQPFFLEQLGYHERDNRHAVALAAAERAERATGGATPAGTERARLARVAALRALGRSDEALEAARALVASSPGSAGGHVELARTLLAKGQTADAQAAVDAALAADPGDLQALALKFWPDDPGDLAKVGAALPALTAFAQAHRTAAGAQRSLARAMLTVGRTDEALTLFGEAVALAPGDDEMRAEYWAELGKAQRFDDILADAAKIDDMKKRDWKLRWNEAEAYSGQGKKVEARACFTALNHDDTLHVDIRKRAKRAVKSLGEEEPG